MSLKPEGGHCNKRLRCNQLRKQRMHDSAERSIPMLCMAFIVGSARLISTGWGANVRRIRTLNTHCTVIAHSGTLLLRRVTLLTVRARPPSVPYGVHNYGCIIVRWSLLGARWTRACCASKRFRELALRVTGELVRRRLTNTRIRNDPAC
jgi:hypothetical protein